MRMSPRQPNVWGAGLCLPFIGMRRWYTCACAHDAATCSRCDGNGPQIAQQVTNRSSLDIQPMRPCLLQRLTAAPQHLFIAIMLWYGGKRCHRRRFSVGNMQCSMREQTPPRALPCAEMMACARDAMQGPLLLSPFPPQKYQPSWGARGC
jgi:hypothetical protein